MKPADTHVDDRLAAHLAGELGPESESEVRHHLESCGRCRESCRAMAETLAVLEILEEPAVAAGPSAWPSIRDRTFGAPVRTNPWFFGRTPFVRGALAMVSVAAGLALGILIPGWEQALTVQDTVEGLTAELWADSRLLEVDDIWTSDLGWLTMSDDDITDDGGGR